ncbi:MAG: phage/plasmid primase, P4 family [Lachnospiraceae bacterium]|nr:phage/plasmid primase, P4 family [Lachnospiraceae bacterium]
MLIHIDNRKFSRKPAGMDIGGIKARFTNPGSIQDLTAAQIAEALCKGQTVQPGVTPFSERNRKKGKTGTCSDDFQQQTIFMNDIDNKRTDSPIETPAHVAEVLKPYNLPVAFAYPTFSSSPQLEKFRFAVVCDEVITDDKEREAIQGALIKFFPQSDPECVNADRIFFGTDKELYAGVGDLTAVCRKADLLAFAQTVNAAQEATETEKPKFGQMIPTGQRHGTLVSFAATVLKKYGISDKAFELYMQRVGQCEEPKADSEIEKIWKDACRYYEKEVASKPEYIAPDEYATKEFADAEKEEKPKRRGTRKPPISYYTGLAPTYMQEHTYLVGVQHLSKGGYGNDTLYEYVGGVWHPRSETDVKSQLAKRVARAGVVPDPKQINKSYQLVMMQGKRKNVETFNQDENLVCFQNGVYRLSDGARLEHSPEYYFTTQLKANIPDSIQETTYCDMCISNFGGADVQKLLLQIFGAAISNVSIPRFKKAVLQYGKGDTGKTQLKALAEMVLGSGRYNNVDLSDLETNRFLSASFQNVRLGGSNDMSNVRVKELKIFKQLTGGDSIQAENKGEKAFTFRYKGLMWFLANQLPLFGGDKGEHVYNRWILIPCTNPVPPEKQIKDLAARMFTERDSFCIKALQAFQEAVADNYTFAVPDSCKAANAEYRRVNSTVRTFLDECCEPFNPDDSKTATTTGKFWNGFKQWCKDCNLSYQPGKQEFRRELATIAGVTEKELDRHTKDGNFYPYVIKWESYKELCPWDVPPLS